MTGKSTRKPKTIVVEHAEHGVFNPGPGPLPLDTDGRVIAGGEHRMGVDLQLEPVAGHIAAGRLIPVVRNTPSETSEED